MKKILCFILFSLLLSMDTIGIYALSLPSGTPVTVEPDSVYNSAVLQTGSEVDFRVVNDVVSNMDKVEIKAGTPVKAKVLLAKKRGRIGKPGKITLGEFYTTSAKGEKVPLSGTIASQGESKKGLSIALSIIVIPFFLFMRGKDTQITTGMQYTLYTAN